MYDFKYVTKSEYASIKKDLIKLINSVQNKIRDKFTFRYDFIGSSKRNMITMDAKSNVGFDFDINLRVNDEDEKYSAAEIKHLLMNAFNSVMKQGHSIFNYSYCEDSTRVFTIKIKDIKNSRILHSCDFAIVYDCSNGQQKYIRHNKPQRSYCWEYQPMRPSSLEKKEQFIKQKIAWNNVRRLYIKKKNENTNNSKKSRSLYVETINEIYNKIKKT